MLFIDDHFQHSSVRLYNICPQAIKNAASLYELCMRKGTEKVKKIAELGLFCTF